MGRGISRLAGKAPAEFLGFWGVSPCAARPIIATHRGLGADWRHPPCEGRERSAFFRSRPSCGGVPKKRKKDGRKPWRRGSPLPPTENQKRLERERLSALLSFRVAELPPLILS